MLYFKKLEHQVYSAQIAFHSFDFTWDKCIRNYIIKKNIPTKIGIAILLKSDTHQFELCTIFTWYDNLITTYLQRIAEAK
jgi:hypothetical protein